MKREKIVNFVHAIDTEGPLYETVQAKFDRLKDLFGISNIEASRQNLEKLKRGDITLDGRETDVIRILNGHLANYNDTWDKIDAMLDRIMSPEFRDKYPDSFGRGWVYNWHCLDHVGFEYNPRRRDMGYHNIFDHYAEVIRLKGEIRDGLHWHFHPISTYRDAHRCATSFVNTPELYQILCRRIIERDWFPTVFRAGFQTERPDSNWFLEQWVPFDISNMAIDDPSEYDRTIDFKNGRSGDWRLAPADWSVYHPSHDNYQTPGNCRRLIGRALNVLNRIASVDQREMDKAFSRANEGLPTLVGFASHDFRDLGTEVDHLRELIRNSAKKYPEVRFRYCEGIEAFRHIIAADEDISRIKPLELEIIFHPATERDVPSLEVVTKSGKVFGPQPFLAIKTKSRRYIHDNLDFSINGDRWFYAFHGDTLPLEDVSEVGIAANDRLGNLCVRKMAF